MHLFTSSSYKRNFKTECKINNKVVCWNLIINAAAAAIFIALFRNEISLKCLLKLAHSIQGNVPAVGCFFIIFTFVITLKK